MKDTKLRIEMNWDGASLEKLTWRDVQELVRALHEGVKTLDPDADVTRLIPIKHSTGSVATVLRIPAVARRPVARILRGPNKTWTPRDHIAAEPIQTLMRKRNATMAYRIGRGAKREVRQIEVQETPDAIASTSRFFAFVAGLGGRGEVPWVNLRIGGTLKQRATIRSHEHMRLLGQLFWDNAYVTLDYLLDPVTGDMLKAVVVGVERYRHHALIDHIREGGTIDLATQYENSAALIAERHDEA